MKPILLTLLLALTGSAQTISSITISDADQHHCRVVANISVDSYVHITYGTISGGPYPWNTYRYLTGQDTNGGGDHNQIALNIAALAPGTIYYGVILAGSTLTTDSVASSEFTCTSTNGSIYPTAPTAYLPAYPTTTGYTTVPLTVSSNLFVAASSASHTAATACPSDPGWSVSAGDSLATIIGEVKFGAIIEFPQGVTGQTPPSTPGYILPVLAVDPCSSGIADPNHRWVILRTHQNSASDFPPYGFRTGPSWAGKLATLQSESPQGLFGNGQHFSFFLQGSSAIPIHHFWISNLNLSIDTGQGNQWGNYISLSNTEGDPDDAKTPVSYTAIERVVFTTASPPVFSVDAIAGGIGTDVMIRGNYMVGFQRSAGLGLGIYIEDCSTGPLTIDNNEVDAAGQGIYFETNDTATCGAGPYVPLRNASVTHNTIYEPPTWLNPVNAGYGAWDGVSRGLFRNPFEAKYCQYCLLKGNWIDGSFSGQNSGQAILWTGTINPNQTPGVTGQHDLEVTGNLVRHASVLMDAQGSETISDCCGYGPDVSSTERLYFHDNAALDLGRYLYTQSGSGGGLFSNYFENFGVQGQIIRNNTLGFNDAECCTNSLYYTPQLQTVSDGGPSNGGFEFSHNLVYASQGVGANTYGILAYLQTCPGGCATFPVVPLPTITSSRTILATNAVSLTTTVNPTGLWTYNAIICGNVATGAWPWPDLTSGGCGSLAATMPLGDSYPPGNTIAARETATGLLNIGNDDLTVTPTAYNLGGAVGANLFFVESSLGVVNQVSVDFGSTAIAINYTAPDTNSCSADVSSDGGVTWTRQADAGGNRIRSLTFTSLPSATPIKYRLMCYYAQIGASGPDRPWFSFPSDPSNMQTEGTVSTAASATRTVYTTFTLPASATKVVVSFQPVTGSPVSATCTTSPCSVASVPVGIDARTLTFQTSGSVTVGVPSVVSVTVN